MLQTAGLVSVRVLGLLGGYNHVAVGGTTLVEAFFCLLGHLWGMSDLREGSNFWSGGYLG